MVGAMFLAGCAGGTTDPRQGGLFSYDPAAYEQRLADRENNLDAVKNDTSVQKKKNRQLKNSYYSEKKKLNTVN